MAKKTRMQARKKPQKKSKTARNKTAAKKKTKRKARPKTVKNKITGAYRTVIDTFKDTDRLRNKMEPPGTSETE